MLLAKDGIFPITQDKDGLSLPGLPASGFSFPGTIQGEGKLCGVPSLFIRLAGCNLHCSWTTADGSLSPCDTAYAAYEPEGVRSFTVDDIESTVRKNTGAIRHIVITGGEPFLQANELKSLCSRLKKNNFYHLTVETNATIFDAAAAHYIDLFSLSPKLSSSHISSSHAPTSLRPDIIQAFINCAVKNNKAFQLKFVHACEEDIRDIRELLGKLQGWKQEDVLLMPLGGTPDLLRSNSQKTLEHCILNGWRYCDRLHLSLFGDKAGV